MIDSLAILFCESLDHCPRDGNASFSPQMPQIRRDTGLCAHANSTRSWPILLLLLLVSLSIVPIVTGCGGASIPASVATETSGSFSASPSTVSFGSVTVGQTASSTVSLINQGSTAVQVSGVTVSSQSFSVSGAANLPLTVAAGGTVNLTVNFAPTGVGTATGQLTIQSDSSVNATLLISLTGTGTSATGTSPAPALTVSASSVAFGNVNLNTTATLPLTLTSAGNLPVTISAINVTGSGFTASGIGVPLTLNPNQEITLQVQFSPTATGTFSGVLTLMSNASGDTTIAIGLSGMGTILILPTLASLNCANSSLTGSGTDTCSVALSATAPNGGISVGLASSNSAVTVPNSVMIPGGATTASFAATVAAVSSAQTATITATTANNSETFVLHLGASGLPMLTGLTCANSSMTGAGTDSCTVALNVATSAGFQVNLASNDSAVTVPATVTVPAGATSASFSATVAAVGSAQTAVLTASAGGTTQSFSIQLGGSSSSLAVSASSINFGDVLLNTPSTQTLSLSDSSTTPITVSVATATGAGFSVSGATFPLAVGPGQPATLQVTFNPTVAGSSTGTLTIVTTSSTTPTVVTLGGTGVTVAYQVNLTWDAPNSLDDPIAGYDVFRSGDGGNTYLPMTGSPVIQTAYTDTSVQDGQTYVYMVESVDLGGVQSSPSNLASVMIPAGP